MGKIKDRRFKVHQSVSSANTNSAEIKTTANLPLLPTRDDIFSGIKIDFSDVKKLDFDCDTRSITGWSHREIKKEEQHLPKKEKLRRRHERFLLKLDLMQQMKKQMKEKRKKSKSSGFDDTIPLLEPFTPDIEKERKIKPSTSKKVVPRPSMKARKRQREHLKDMKHFNKVLNDKGFISDPITTITSFLKQQVAAEKNFD